MPGLERVSRIQLARNEARSNLRSSRLIHLRRNDGDPVARRRLRQDDQLGIFGGALITRDGSGNPLFHG
jgi:hypothetical protein